jgi:phospholipid-binding lipoprotein MlaA
VVLPLFGSSTLRDTAAWPIDRRGDLLRELNDIPVRNSLYFVRVIDGRANLLRAGQLLDDAALDKYSFTRDAFLQRRRNEVHDGDLPNDGNE